MRIVRIPALLVSIALLLVSWSPAVAHAADDAVFSGPQVGEAITPFKARHALGEEAGEDFDVVTQADGKPVFIIFVHEVTRPSVGLTRLLSTYANQRTKDDLNAAVVFLSADATETESWMKRAQHALPKSVPIGISVDGQEGPGAYGLNREVSLTMLVAKDNKVTANFALVQPSVQADGPQVLKAIVDVLGGGDVPTLAELGGERYMRRPENSRGPSPELTAMLRAVINKSATEEEVDSAATELENHFAKNPQDQAQVRTIANRIFDAGKLENYGTPKAQEYIRRWAEAE